MCNKEILYFYFQICLDLGEDFTFNICNENLQCKFVEKICESHLLVSPTFTRWHGLVFLDCHYCHIRV